MLSSSLSPYFRQTLFLEICRNLLAAFTLHAVKTLVTEQGSMLWRCLQGLSRFWLPVSCQRSWSAASHPSARQQPLTSEFVLAEETGSCPALCKAATLVSCWGRCCCLIFSLLQSCASNSGILFNLAEHTLFHRIHMQYESNESPGFRSVYVLLPS